MERPVSVISHPWREVWRGANDLATGSGYDADGWLIWEGERYPQIVAKLDAVPLTPAFEVEADKVFRDEAQTFIANDPVAWFRLAVTKVLMLWTIDPYYPKAQHPLYVVPTLAMSLSILAAFFLAVQRLRRRSLAIDALLPFIVVGVMLTGVFGITYIQPRYQTYLLTALSPLLAVVIMILQQRTASRRVR
jgi:hypothetical protein